MPNPHFDAVIASLVEPWFYGAPRSAGLNYGRLLTDKFNARREPDQAAIESGLALGFYVVHSEANKRQRMALRAAMLAYVLMRGLPAQDLLVARKRFESLTVDALKRAFVNQFPMLEGDVNRQSWDPAFFTEPILLPDLRLQQAWNGKQIPDYMFIVHTNEFPQTPSAVFQNPIQELSKYSASSFSLMSRRKPQTYFPQGLIFRVPSNNILVTYHADLLSVLRENSVHGATFGKQTFAEEITELSMATGSGGLLSPMSIIRDQNPANASIGVQSVYNELLICGRSGVPLPHGLTGALRLRGLFISIGKDGKLAGPLFNAEDRHRACKDHARRLNVPLLYLPNAA